MATTRTDPLARALKRIWAHIPEGRWLPERELDELLIKASGAYEGDFARASALRAQLLTAGALEARRIEGSRECEYRRGEWTEWPFNGYGSDPFNAELARQSENEQARLRAVDEQRAQEFENGPWGMQRRQIIELVEETVDRRIGEMLRELDEPVIARMRARLAVVSTDDDDAA